MRPVHPSGFGLLESSRGSIIVDGAHIDLNAIANALIASGGGVTLKNAAVVNMTTSSSLGNVENATLTLTGADTSLSGNRMGVAPFTNTTGSIVAEDQASLNLTGTLFVGDGSGSDGSLSVSSGGRVSVSTSAAFGIESGSTGTALVENAGSVFSAGSLSLGGRSSGIFGGTFIEGGMVLANNTGGGFALGSGEVEILNGAALGGSGLVEAFVHVRNGGTLSPGNSPGTLTLGSVDLEGSSVLAIELGGTITALYDHSIVTGNFDSFNAPDSQNWKVEYDYANGRVNLGVIPEPSIALLTILGTVSLLARRGFPSE